MIRKLAAVAALTLFTTAAFAQDYPSKPIRVVIPYAAGNTGDIAFRLLMPTLEKKLNARFIIDNKAGASGNIGAAEVVRAAPDGYTLLLGATNNFVTNQFIYKSMTFDPIVDLVPITMVSDAPSFIVTNQKVPAQTLGELTKYATANPGKLNFGSPGAGTPPHLAAELYSQLTNTKLVHVPFKGSPPAVLALIANDIQIYVTALPSVESHVKAGTLRALAVASPKRLTAQPNVPTTAEAGVKDLLTGNWWGLAAPKGTDAKIVDLLAREIKAALADPAVQARFAELGMVSVGSTPAEFGTRIREEAAKWKKVIETAGITAE